jgi:flagellar basal body-associated protein FliL
LLEFRSNVRSDQRKARAVTKQGASPFHVRIERSKGDFMTILWIILIVVLVLALLGFFGYRR